MNVTPSRPHPIVREYLAAKRTARWAPGNIANAARVLRYLATHLAADGLDLLDARPAYLNEFLAARLDTGLSPNTVIVDHRQLKAFYAWAHDAEYVTTDPMKGKSVPQPKGEEPDPARMPVLSEADYRAMLATCKRAAKPAGKGTKTCNDARDAAILAVLWTTGMRRGELAELEYRDIDWDELTIHLRKTKGRGKTKSRSVAFDDETLHYLNRYLLRRGNEDGPLFLTTRRAGIRPQAITLMLRRRAAQAGVDRAAAGCAHAFRRALANDWQTNGGGLADLETNMGWKHDGRMAAHYARQTESKRAHSEARRIADLRSGRGARLRAVGE